ncbi:choline-binding transcriptional repressor BetI [Paenochrobactrum glaciei]|uniref:HTH-type transcriptional regulator BetI n=1 Tax=Paenochrobactrum glaciei TaxID=486407 RepID=A0ABP3QJ64_9HYPH
MPKIGMEQQRKSDLISAAIRTIGERGSLDVTVAQIAKQAGVSSALAHHYFGSKEHLILETMRHLLRELHELSAQGLRQAKTPRARLSAIIEVNFSPSQFSPSTIAAWLTFYVHAQRSDDMRRLLNIYASRLHSNLMHDLTALTSRDQARHIAKGAGALIDGLYIRHALGTNKSDAERATTATMLVEDYISSQLLLKTTGC